MKLYQLADDLETYAHQRSHWLVVSEDAEHELSTAFPTQQIAAERMACIANATGFRVLPCVDDREVIDYGNSTRGITGSVRRPEDGETSEFWGVYALGMDGLEMHLLDFKTEDEAEEGRELLISEQRAHLQSALREIAATNLWGEPITDKGLRDEHRENGEYDDEEGFQPSADNESTMLRDCVETARGALGLPMYVDMPESEAA